MGNRIFFSGAELMERWQTPNNSEFREYLTKRYKVPVPPEWWEGKPDEDNPDTTEWEVQGGFLPAFNPMGSSVVLRSMFVPEELGFTSKQIGLEGIPGFVIEGAEDDKRREQIEEADNKYGLENLTFRVGSVLEFEKQHGLLEEKRKKELVNRKWLTGEEIMDRWGVSELDLQYYVYANDKELPPHVHFGPLDGGMQDPEWEEYSLQQMEFSVSDVLAFEEKYNLIPRQKAAKNQGYKKLKEDKSTGLGEFQVQDMKPLDGKKRRELGRLRQQKEKWDASIEAGVHAALFCQEKGGNVKREELWNELFQFRIPEDTIRKIWNVLRDKKLTKGPGRPSKMTE